ncbi:GNAT family N-acetyltransferase [Oceanirhabdus sp. W0125-5]|uniref:GNAT family N-acetyltransferase n=1 Tax=Oceanirhabdus sp. W0125-5 TaxID=2999116 RepID=UPI0022F2BAB7|nr:GNAT family protein [Oceanirhabdus sp. W0125-5]WBW99228.1 GNAT family protein [Oceanirhabdus sp. W0125-5]
MKIRFEEFKDEIDTLVEFLTSDTWEFYGTPNPNPDRIRAAYNNKYYTGEGIKTFWIVSDDDKRVGMLRVYDLDDGAPLFDIRILSSHKGRGLGTRAVNWLVDYIFNQYTNTDRIEGNTRQDNYAMRCVFHKCGFAKEAHYRKGWVCRNGDVYDSVGYGITKEDWQNGKTTPVNWNDFKV